MNLTDIKRLVKLVETSDIEELHIQEKGFQIRITKRKGVSGGQTTGVVPSVIPQVVSSAPPETKIKGAKVEPAEGEKSDNVVEICSPMVGTFYRAPAPDTKLYVEVGEEIHPGQILCIVEAMKLMNEIEAEISGKIVKILVENAQPVEYNQPLFLVEKT